MTENNEERLGKVVVDTIKADANDTFWNEKAKDLREQIKSIEFSLDYIQYQGFCLNKKRAELMKDYQECLGLEVKDVNTTKA